MEVDKNVLVTSYPPGVLSTSNELCSEFFCAGRPHRKSDIYSESLVDDILDEFDANNTLPLEDKGEILTRMSHHLKTTNESKKKGLAKAIRNMTLTGPMARLANTAHETGNSSDKNIELSASNKVHKSGHISGKRAEPTASQTEKRDTKPKTYRDSQSHHRKRKEDSNSESYEDDVSAETPLLTMDESEGGWNPEAKGNLSNSGLEGGDVEDDTNVKSVVEEKDQLPYCEACLEELREGNDLTQAVVHTVDHGDAITDTHASSAYIHLQQPSTDLQELDMISRQHSNLLVMDNFSRDNSSEKYLTVGGNHQARSDKYLSYSGQSDKITSTNFSNMPSQVQTSAVDAVQGHTTASSAQAMIDRHVDNDVTMTSQVFLTLSRVADNTNADSRVQQTHQLSGYTKDASDLVQDTDMTSRVESNLPQDRGDVIDKSVREDRRRSSVDPPASLIPHALMTSPVHSPTQTIAGHSQDRTVRDERRRSVGSLDHVGTTPSYAIDAVMTSQPQSNSGWVKDGGVDDVRRRSLDDVNEVHNHSPGRSYVSQLQWIPAGADSGPASAHTHASSAYIKLQQPSTHVHDLDMTSRRQSNPRVMDDFSRENYREGHQVSEYPEQTSGHVGMTSEQTFNHVGVTSQSQSDLADIRDRVTHENYIEQISHVPHTVPRPANSHLPDTNMTSETPPILPDGTDVSAVQGMNQSVDNVDKTLTHSPGQTFVSQLQWIPAGKDSSDASTHKRASSYIIHSQQPSTHVMNQRELNGRDTDVTSQRVSASWDQSLHQKQQKADATNGMNDTEMTSQSMSSNWNQFHHQRQQQTNTANSMNNAEMTSQSVSANWNQFPHQRQQKPDATNGVNDADMTSHIHVNVKNAVDHVDDNYVGQLEYDRAGHVGKEVSQPGVPIMSRDSLAYHNFKQVPRDSGDQDQARQQIVNHGQGVDVMSRIPSSVLERTGHFLDDSGQNFVRDVDMSRKLSNVSERIGDNHGDPEQNFVQNMGMSPKPSNVSERIGHLHGDSEKNFGQNVDLSRKPSDVSERIGHSRGDPAQNYVSSKYITLYRQNSDSKSENFANSPGDTQHLASGSVNTAGEGEIHGGYDDQRQRLLKHIHQQIRDAADKQPSLDAESPYMSNTTAPRNVPERNATSLAASSASARIQGIDWDPQYGSDLAHQNNREALEGAMMPGKPSIDTNATEHVARGVINMANEYKSFQEIKHMFDDGTSHDDVTLPIHSRNVERDYVSRESVKNQDLSKTHKHFPDHQLPAEIPAGFSTTRNVASPYISNTSTTCMHDVVMTSQTVSDVQDRSKRESRDVIPTPDHLSPANLKQTTSDAQSREITPQLLPNVHSSTEYGVRNSVKMADERATRINCQKGTVTLPDWRAQHDVISNQFPNTSSPCRVNDVHMTSRTPDTLDRTVRSSHDSLKARDHRCGNSMKQATNVSARREMTSQTSATLHRRTDGLARDSVTTAGGRESNRYTTNRHSTDDRRTFDSNRQKPAGTVGDVSASRDVISSQYSGAPTTQVPCARGGRRTESRTKLTSTVLNTPSRDGVSNDSRIQCVQHTVHSNEVRHLTERTLVMEKSKPNDDRDRHDKFITLRMNLDWEPDQSMTHLSESDGRYRVVRHFPENVERELNERVQQQRKHVREEN